MGLHLAGRRAIGDSAASANWVVETLVKSAHFGPVIHDHPRHEERLGRGNRGERGGQRGACVAGHRGGRRRALSEQPPVL